MEEMSEFDQKLEINRINRLDKEISSEVMFFIRSTEFKFLNHLSDAEKYIVFQRYVHKFTYARIAISLKVSSPGVRSRCKVAISKLDRYLKNDIDIHGITLDTPIDCTNMTIRTINCLDCYGFKTMKELIGYPVTELKKARNIGNKCVIEIQAFLKKFGGSLDFSLVPKKKSAEQKLQFQKAVKLLSSCWDESRETFSQYINRIFTIYSESPTK
jgi:hypothetical protein